MIKTKKNKNYILLHLTLFWVLLLIYGNIYCQVFDDFTDGDFTNNPEWFGETNKFQISNSSAIPPEQKPALQLNNSETDTTILFLQNSLMNNTEWIFWIKLSFNTTANNFARVYLVSDDENLKGILNGYFVQIGGTNDSIGLYRQQGHETLQIISSTFAFTGNNTNILRIKIKRDNIGNWEMFSDSNGGFSFEQEGIGFDNTFTNTSYFGIYCKYTSSNATKFYFDDFKVEIPVIDTILPEIENISVLSANSVDVTFSEDVDIFSGEEINNYSLNAGIGTPLSAIRNSLNHNKVTLEFEISFEEGINYTLSISDISDLSGNLMEYDFISFVYTALPPVNIDGILINEIMADQNPLPTNLPEADYLELYNTSSESINIANFSLKPRESADPVLFPDVLIYPDSFLIVVSTTNVEWFEPYGQVVGLSGFSLNNEGIVVLRNPQGNLVHAINYSNDWYKDEIKEEGGWSLEQIDPSHPCTGEPNWTATINEDGGTPGRRNSVDAVLVTYPKIETVEAINDKTVKITFTENMDSLSITYTNNYFVEGFGNPTEAITGDISFDFVELSFSTSFEEQVIHELSITDTLWNCAGNFITPKVNSFVLPSKANPYDIVINEIMFDPDPPVGLPAFEYVEIFNITDDYLLVEGWNLEIGTTLKPIPYFIIEPNEYVIFIESDGELIFSLFGRSIGFSSLGLSNSGTSIKLMDSDYELISFVEYSDDWISDSDKADGGWSIEQIDPFNPCIGSENWDVSLDNNGGTPGVLNSIDSENYISPKIKSAFAINDSTVEIQFNQSMEKSSMLDNSLYYIDNGIDTPSNVYLSDSIFQSIILIFNNTLQTRIIYTISIESSILNCTGENQVAELTFKFGKHENTSNNDIVINEVLFNPVGDGVDFVELYNRSEKILNLKDLKLGEVDVDYFGNSDTSLKSISSNNQLLLMEDYKVLSSNPTKVKEQYFTENPDAFLKMESFPSYSNESGTVVLTGKNNIVIDAMEYNEDMHFPLLNTVDGVSLERLSPDRSSADETNWHSASKEVGYATPAYLNSQFTETTETDEEVTVEPEIFSPDNDGYNDILNIHYQFSSPGFTATITIFDSQGRQVKILLQNSLLGTSGTFSWDGRTDDNQKANIGIYIVFFEAFDANGNVKKFKKTAVLGGKIGN